MKQPISTRMEVFDNNLDEQNMNRIASIFRAASGALRHLHLHIAQQIVASRSKKRRSLGAMYLETASTNLGYMRPDQPDGTQRAVLRSQPCVMCGRSVI